MDVQFETAKITCLEPVFQEVRSTELTQQIKLPDAMPDVGKILMAWGQPILRGKEWADGQLSANGGMLVWVLYEPEDGNDPQCLDGWIPFQLKWDLPEEATEGTARFTCRTRLVEGRGVSPRKITVRCNLAVQAQAYSPVQREMETLAKKEGEVELLEEMYPLRLMKEAGEKAFPVEEELTLPDSAPQPEKLLYCRMEPRVTDKKVLADKVVFRGNGNLHVLYRSEEGRLQSWDFALPFSQYAQLDGEYGADAQTDVVLAVTGLECELADEGSLRVKAGIAAQYLISEKQMLTVLEDAYCPNRELSLKQEEVALPVVLDSRREELYAEQTLREEAEHVADVSFLPDFPRQRWQENGVELEIPGVFQLLYYGADGTLCAATAKWEGRQSLPADERSHITALPLPQEPQAVTGGGQILVKAELPVDLTTTAQQQLTLIAGLELGEQKIPDPNRPALILRRAGEGRLWDLAKASGAAMADIRRANGLEGEPVPGQMLLIPVK